MLTINDIPFSYLAEWAKANRNEHPELSYLRTLSQKPESSSFGQWGDVLSRLPAKMPLQKLITALDLCKDAILLDYADDSESVVLPQNASSYTSFYERIKAFIQEYRKEVERPRSSISEAANRGQKNRAKIIEETFEFSRGHATPTNRGIIAEHLELKRQRVDQLLNNEIVPDFVRCLSGETEFLALSQKVGDMVSVDTFLKYSGVDQYDGRTIEFLVSVLNMSMMEQEGVRIPVVAKNRILVDYKQQLGQIISFFRNEVIGIRTDMELKAKLSEISDEGLRSAFHSLIMNSNEFIKYSYEGAPAVALDWKLLYTKSARICWILYQNKAFDYKTALYQDELISQYNTLAKEKGENQITVDQLPAARHAPECWKVMTIGKSGYWKLRMTQREDYDIDQIIRNYLETKGDDASFVDFMNIMREEGHTRFYEERSLRTRYTGNGGTTGKRVVIKRRIVNKYSDSEKRERLSFIIDYLETIGRTCTNKELFETLVKKYPTTNLSNVNMWVEELRQSKRINADIGSGRRPTYISALSVEISKPRSAADDIRDKAVEILLSEPSHAIETRVINPILIKLVPASVNAKITYVSKALHNDPRLVFTGPQGHSTVSLSKTALLELSDQK